MSRLIVCGLLWLLAMPTRSQSVASQTNLPLALNVPAYIDGLTDADRSLLETKLTDLLTSNGLTVWSVPGNLALSPTLRLLNEQTVNPGLQPVIVLDGTLTLTLSQPTQTLVFSTITKRLRGSGRTRDLALTNLFGQLRSDDADLIQFLAQSREKAVAYYNRSCGDIRSRAARLAQVRQYEQALGLLLSVPSATTCADAVQTQAAAVFQQYQQQRCAGLLTQARARLAARDFNGGLALLSLIDPQSTCAADTRKLIDEAARQTAGDNQQRWTVLQQAFTNLNTLEQYRLRLMSDIVTGFYQQ